MTSPGKKQPTQPNWSEASIPEWQKYTLGPQAVRKIPEGYVIIKMYTTSRNGVNPNSSDVDINGERCCPVEIKQKSTGRTKWVNLNEDEPTVRTFVKETMATENAPRAIVEKLLL